MITYKITPIRPRQGVKSLVDHRGYAVRFYNADGSPHFHNSDAVMRFFGIDERKVRAEAIAFAEDYVKSQLEKGSPNA